ncbi:hypothetical protein MASR2M70_20320 [Bacillota bacterium]
MREKVSFLASLRRKSFVERGGGEFWTGAYTDIREDLKHDDNEVIRKFNKQGG